MQHRFVLKSGKIGMFICFLIGQTLAAWCMSADVAPDKNSSALRSKHNWVALGGNLPPIDEIAIGPTHAVVLWRDGQIQCFGRNDLGQCTVPLGVGRITHVYAGNGFSAVQTQEEKLITFGGVAAFPADVRARHVACHINEICVLTPDGKALILEDNEFGSINIELPRGDVKTLLPDKNITILDSSGVIRSLRRDKSGRDSAIPGVTGRNAVSAIAGAYSPSGKNLMWLLSDGSVGGTGQDWKPATTPGKVDRIAWADGWKLASTTDGSVCAWVTGNDLVTLKSSAPFTRNVKQLTVGLFAGIAVFEDGSLRAIGSDFLGSLRICREPRRGRSISFGCYGGMAVVCEDGLPLWMGGLGSEEDNIPLDIQSVESVACGGAHICGVSKDGAVWAFGKNDAGQCNVPEMSDKVVAVAAGAKFSVALLRDGTVRCWGDNSGGACDVPKDLRRVRQIAAGENCVVAISDKGQVACWGSIGATSAATGIPTGIHDAISVSVGNAHIIALTQDGKVYAWGDNRFGQCTVPSVSDVVGVAAGLQFSAALRKDGSLVTWGHCSLSESVPPLTSISAGSDFIGGVSRDGAVVAVSAHSASKDGMMLPLMPFGVVKSMVSQRP